MNYLYRSVITAAFAVCFACQTTYAAGEDTCQDLVKACFASALGQRDACIQTAAANSLCSSSQFGALVAKRAQFSEIPQLSDEQGPAFLGPQIINRRCVSKFDTAWSAALVNGDLSKDSIASFNKALEECATSDSKTLPHP